MNRSCFWLLAITSSFTMALLGCGERANRTPSRVEAERWAAAWIGALNSRSLEQVNGLLPPEARYWSTMLVAPIGSSEVPRHVQTFWRLFPRGRVERRAVHRGPGHVIVEWRAWPDASEQEKVWNGVTVLTFGHKGLREVKTFFDPIVLLPYFYGTKR